MKISVRLVILTFTLLFHSVLSSAVPNTPPKTRILLLESKNNRAISAFSNHLRTTLYLNNPTMDIQRASIEQPELVLDTPLIITLGKEAMEQALKTNYKGHILAALVEAQEFHQIIKAYTTGQQKEDVTPRISAIFHEASLVRQLLLFKELKPAAKRVGLLLSPDEQMIVENLKPVANHLDLLIENEIVNNPSDLSHDLVKLINRSEAIIATTNSRIYNRSTIKSILLSLYRYNKFLIGSNKNFIRAGSVATTYTSSQQLIEEMVTEINYFFNHQKLKPAHYCHEFMVAINKDVAHSLNLSVKDEQYYIDAIKAGEITLGKLTIYE
jgi:hypothetical protein